ncbi:MAG: hypothetical protein ACYC8T_07285 [Myxococcaceae bacterium]
MTRALWAIIVGLALGGCVSRPTNLRKSAVVPHLAPPGWGGQALPARAGIGVRSSNLVLPPDAAANPGRPSGVYLAQSEAQLDARFRLWDRLEVSALFDLALEQTAAATTDEVPARPGGPAIGFGLGSRYSVLTGRFELGIGLDLFLYSIPVRIQSERETAQSAQLIGVYSFSLLPGFHYSDRLAFFGGVTARNHPDILKATTETLGAWQGPAGATTGPTNVLLSAGASYQVSRFLLVHGQLYQNVVDYPVSYRAPGVDVGITLLLGDPPATKAPLPAPEPPVLAEPPPYEAPPPAQL